jgi:hypothetical protein
MSILYIFLQRSGTFELSSLEAFVDDSTLLTVEQDVPNLIDHANRDLEVVARCFYQNRLLLNGLKTLVLFFGPKRLQNPATGDFRIAGDTIEVVQSAKLLGFTIDNQLSYKRHIAVTCAKLAGVNAMLLKLRLACFPRHTLIVVYRAFFQSYLSYCGSITYFGNRGSIQKLQVMSNRAIRIIFGLGYRESTQQAAFTNKIETVRELLRSCVLKVVFSQTVATGGAKVLNLLVASNSTSQTRTRLQESGSLFVPGFSTEIRRNTIYIAGIQLL